jgi:hypothetical protein
MKKGDRFIEVSTGQEIEFVKTNATEWTFKIIDIVIPNYLFRAYIGFNPLLSGDIIPKP